MKTVLTIAGSDSSGGAGIQADLKTITAHKLYGMSAITALTAQNTTGVYGVMNVTPEFLEQEIDCIFNDIYPDAVKIGMVSNADLIQTIADKLTIWKAHNIVLDPVMIATSGSRLLEPEAMERLMHKLLPVADLITPNIPEAEELSGRTIHNQEDMMEAAKAISELTNASILIKGGHMVETANDLLYHNGEMIWLFGERVDNPNTHGTGCTLSSAIASNLAQGYDVPESVRRAKEYLTGALKAQMNLGKGSGPLKHWYTFESHESGKKISK